MTVNVRARRVLAVAAVVMAVAIGVPRFLTHTPYPRMGLTVDRTQGQSLPRVQEVIGPPAKGLLRPGDVLLAHDGISFGPPPPPGTRLAPLPRGPIQLAVLRSGQVLKFTLPPVNLSAYQRVRLFLYPLFAVIAAPLVAFLLVWRRPDLGAAWAFLWFAAMQGLGVIYDRFQFPQVEPTAGFKVYLDLYGRLTLWYPASLLHFLTVFPRARWRGMRMRKSAWFWALVLSYLTPVAIIVWSSVTKQKVDGPYTWFQTVALLLGVVALVDRFARRRYSDWRPTRTNRVLALLVAVALAAGAALGAFADDPRIATLMTMPLLRWLIYAIGIAWLTSPLVIAYLIADDPAFDPRRLLATSLPYFLLSGVLAGLYLAIVLTAQRLFAAATGEETLAVNVIAALAVAFALAPLREPLQRALNRLFGRDPEVLRLALDEAGRDLLGALDRDEVRAAVDFGLARGLRRDITLEWPEQGPPRLADPEEVPEDFRPAVGNLLMQAGIRLENLALQEQRAAAERRAAEMREAATRAELRALHAQVQPHFLFNALNALSYLTETDPPAAQRFTERLADMLRYTVEASERPAALLSEEIGFVEDYLGVARERYENQLAFEFHGARELLSLAVPPLLLQPLVENSLKHGLAPDAEALHLTLDARRDDGWVTLTFTDDGSASGNGAPSLGVGLQNLEQRVRRFSGSDVNLSAGAREGGGYIVVLRWHLPPPNGPALHSREEHAR